MSNPFASPSLASFQSESGKGPADGGLFNALVDHRGWIRLCGIVSIIFGVLFILGIWTIVIAWLPIWMGICLLNSATALAPDGTFEMRQEAARKLSLFFKLMGIFCLIYVGLIALVVVLYIVMAVVMLSQAGV
jgi:hypothetical protein